MGRAPIKLSPEHFDMLGKVSDREVAEAAGCCRLTIAKYRRRHGIAAAIRGQPYASKGPDFEKAAYLRFLGLAYDAEIGEAFGVSRQAVNSARRARKISNPDMVSVSAFRTLFAILDSAEVGATKVTFPRSVYDDLVHFATPKTG